MREPSTPERDPAPDRKPASEAAREASPAPIHAPASKPAPEAGSDARPEATSEAGPGAGPEAISEAISKPVQAPAPGAAPRAASEAGPDASPEAIQVPIQAPASDLARGLAREPVLELAPELAAAETLGELRRAASSWLEQAGVAAASASIDVLLEHVLERERAYLFAHSEERLAGEPRQRFLELLAERARGVPVQHLTGWQEFFGHRFHVSADVLIPRPETEHAVEAALERLPPRAANQTETSLTTLGQTGTAQTESRGTESDSAQADRAKASRAEPSSGEAGQTETGHAASARAESIQTTSARPRIVDVGTGSGAIAVSLALARPDAEVWATEISPAALAVARANAARLGAAVHFQQGDLLAPFLAGSAALPASFDVIVSNPPYIAAEEVPHLQREVRDYEPAVALSPGLSGLEAYARLIPQAAQLLVPGGWLVMEMSYRSADAVRAMLQDWREVTSISDLQGWDRVLCAQWPGNNGTPTRRAVP